VKRTERIAVIVLGILLAGCRCSPALSPSLEISHYLYSAWTAQNDLSMRNISAMAQTSYRNLWFGPLRFDGLRPIGSQPPSSRQLAEKTINSVLIARGRTLWPAISTLRLTQDIVVDHTALSLIAPDEVDLNYKLDAQGSDWQEVINDRGVTDTSYAAAAEPRAAKVTIAEAGDEPSIHPTAKAGSRADPDERTGSPRHFQNIHAQAGDPAVRDLKFTHLTTNDGLSQGYVTSILQDRRGFMWFATRDGLNRYDGSDFVVYKSDPKNPSSLSSSFTQDLMEDDRGYLWIATNTGVNKFDPTTNRFTRYLHDPKNPNSLGGASVKSIAQDSRGCL
jgi:ligand-binding sensor domain-containing protein